MKIAELTVQQSVEVEQSGREKGESICKYYYNKDMMIGVIGSG